LASVTNGPRAGRRIGFAVARLQLLDDGVTHIGGHAVLGGGRYPERPARFQTIVLVERIALIGLFLEDDGL
jgi:hypothetical protein